MGAAVVAMATGALAPAAHAAPTSLDYGQPQVRENGGFVLSVYCDGGAPEGLSGLSAAPGGSRLLPGDAPDDAQALLFYEPPAGYGDADGEPGSVSWTYGGAPFTQEFSVVTDGNNPPYCFAQSGSFPLGFDETAAIGMYCYDDDYGGAIEGAPVFDVIEAGPGAAALGTLGPWSADPAQSLWTATYTLDPYAGGGADTVTTKVTDNFAPNEKSTDVALAVAFPANSPPACANLSANAVAGQAVKVTAACSDRDAGDAVSLLGVVTGPASGTASVAGNELTYAPAAGFEGLDSVTVEAGDGRSRVTFTVTFTVSKPPEAPGPGPAAPPRAITAPVSHDWKVFRNYAKVRRLVIRSAPADAAVEIRCRGRRCPFKRRQVKRAANGSFQVAAVFRRRRVPTRVTLEIRITAPNAIGKVVVYPIKPAKRVQSRTRCLPPGADKPIACA